MLALIYSSKTTIKFNQESLRKFCDQSAARNQELGITGYLYFKNMRFFQYIEGEDEQLLTLIKSLERDERHHITNTLEDPLISKRRFSSWNMKYINSGFFYFDDMIADYFELISKPTLLLELYTDLIWRSLDKIAEFYNRKYS